MEIRIPLSLQPLINAYLSALEPLHRLFYGIYIHGSVALDAFEEQASDIDIVAIMQGEWTSHELVTFEAIHTQLLREYPLSKRLDVLYIPFCDLGKQEEASPHPLLRDGVFVSAAPGGLNAVIWWMTKHQGIRLLGPACSALPVEVSWKDVLAAMHFNLDGYWAGKAKRPYLFLADYWVMTAVATLCRILTAIEEGEIITKSPALTRWRDRLPAHWHPLLDEAWRIRHAPHTPSPYRSRLNRMSMTLAFVKYSRGRGHQGLAAASSGE